MSEPSCSEAVEAVPAKSPPPPSPASSKRRIPTRYLVLALVFAITAVNYADRSSLSITGGSIADELGITSVQLGYIFSAFSWSYVLAQLPGGYLLDRFGARRVYAFSIALWTAVTLLISLVGLLTTPVLVSVVAVFVLRLLLGAFESPAFPANARISTIWFPTAERGRATAVFSAAQYLASALFVPIMAWVTGHFGWRWVFVGLGVIGFALAVTWVRWMRVPATHRRLEEHERALMESGGALTGLDDEAEGLVPQGDRKPAERNKLDRGAVRQILRARALWGVCISQYAINAMTYFLITWFPTYLMEGRGLSLTETGLVAASPAICGFVGGLLGGTISDLLIRRGKSLTFARKAPSVVGMVMATGIVLCTLTDSTALIVTIMTIAFFGKALGALGWAITTDIAPYEASSLVGSIMNGAGNVAGIVTPIVIGYTVAATGSFEVALWFVGAHGLLALIGLTVMGPIRRIVLDRNAEPYTA